MTGRQPFECPLCRRWFPSQKAKAAHTCALTERFFQEAIARWQAAGVHVHIAPTNYGRDAARHDEEP